MSIEQGWPVSPKRCRVEKFYPTGASAGPNWNQFWTRRPDESMAMIIAIGSGAGWWGWATWSTVSVRWGWGWWGSWAIARCLIPLDFLPSILRVNPWRGGAWWAVWGTGTGWMVSIVDIDLWSAQAVTVLQSWAIAATWGTWGSTSGSAAAWAAETISTSTLSVLSNFWLQTFNAGKIGAIGWVVWWWAWAANFLFSTNNVMNGWAGGWTTPASNAEFAWGAQTGVWWTLLPNIPWWVAGGNPGHWFSWFDCMADIKFGYWWSGGGTWGAAGTTAWRWGNWWFPWGGGGWGGGWVTWGIGWRGGDGMVMIISW